MLKVEYIPKEDLKPYANNAKLHTGEQVEQIKRSIQDFGFNDPIAVWHENEVIEGHGRLLAAMELPEVKEIPIIRLDDLTDEQRRAYMLVHNKLTMNTGFDPEILDLELDSIEDFDMGDYGFLEYDEEPYEPLDIEKKDQEEKEIQCPHCKMWFKPLSGRADDGKMDQQEGDNKWEGAEVRRMEAQTVAAQMAVENQATLFNLLME